MPHLEDFRYNESASCYFAIPGHSDKKIYKVVSTVCYRFKKGEIQSVVFAEQRKGYLPVVNPELTTDYFTTFNNYITSCLAAEDHGGNA